MTPVDATVYRITVMSVVRVQPVAGRFAMVTLVAAVIPAAVVILMAVVTRWADHVVAVGQC